MDGVDVVAASFAAHRVTTHGAATVPYPASVRERLLSLIEPEHKATLHQIATLDVEIGEHFAAAANTLLTAAGIAPSQVAAIGSHGQTVRHETNAKYPYSWQIGNAATIAARTGHVTVADFRSLDVALGGEGAPLVPPFHNWLFRSADTDRIIVNIGGIANITVLAQDPAIPLLGFDTGPGNCLMDEWCMRHSGEPFDRNGTWATQGTVATKLLEALLADGYFAAPAPKSTGREMFNVAYVDAALDRADCADVSATDVQATLLEFTATTIADAISLTAESAAVYICGGGAENAALVARLGEMLAPAMVASTADLNLDPAYVEATAFAWLARQRIRGNTVSLPTGAAGGPGLAGAVYDPRRSQ